MQNQPTVRNFRSVNPVTNELIAEFPFLTDEEVNGKIKASWDSYQQLIQTTLESRREKILKLVSIIEGNLEKYGKIITQEMGKPLQAGKFEAWYTAAQAKYYVGKCEALLKPQEVVSGNRKSRVEYLPMGPVFYVVPFNSPFFLSFVGVVPCLLLGNTILYRPADSCPLVGKAIEELFIEAGFTNNEFQTVFTTPDQTELILSNKNVRGASFIGSTKAGRVIGSIAGKYAKKATMELGGSDPFLVLADADIEKAVATAVDSRLYNCGQACCAAKRFIIADSIFDDFKQKLVEKVAEYKIGDPMAPGTQMGPLARPDLLTTLERQVQESVNQGGKLLFGGKRPEDPSLSAGNYFVPAVVELNGPENILFREETFGPAFGLLRVKEEDEMVRLANDSEYGLGCTIFSEDVKRAEKLGEQIESGTCVINGKMYPDLVVPFGGVKGSGFGRQFGEVGMHDFANIRTVTVEEKPAATQ